MSISPKSVVVFIIDMTPGAIFSGCVPLLCCIRMPRDPLETLDARLERPLTLGSRSDKGMIMVVPPVEKISKESMYSRIRICKQEKRC